MRIPKPPVKCSVKGCPERAYTKGRCDGCYRYRHRNGRDRVLTGDQAKRRLERNYEALVRRQEAELIRSIYINAGGL